MFPRLYRVEVVVSIRHQVDDTMTPLCLLFRTPCLRIPRTSLFSLHCLNVFRSMMRYNEFYNLDGRVDCALALIFISCLFNWDGEGGVGALNLNQNHNHSEIPP